MELRIGMFWARSVSGVWRTWIFPASPSEMSLVPGSCSLKRR